MIRRKGYRFRLKINPQVGSMLSRFAGCNRLVWNKALALQKERIENDEFCHSYYQLAPLLKEWKEQEATQFLNDCPSQSLQQTLMNLDRSIKEAFAKGNGKRFPRFKKKGQHDGFRYPQGFKVEGNQIFLPKIGWVHFFKSRKIEGVLKNATVSKRGRHWFVSVQSEHEIDKPVHPSKSMVGIDLGVKRFATVSNGDIVRPLDAFKKLSKKLALEQRYLARKQKGSNNFKENKQKVAGIHIKIKDTRMDYLHKASTSLSKNHACIVLEDLKIRNMSKSAKGNVEKPGKNVKAKSGLNRSILDQGWHAFKTMLNYKLDWLGGELINVDPKYTSQKCSKCGHRSPENRTSQARFSCTQCGFAVNADLNAARNIEAAGHAVLACGDIRPRLAA